MAARGAPQSMQEPPLTFVRMRTIHGYAVNSSANTRSAASGAVAKCPDDRSALANEENAMKRQSNPDLIIFLAAAIRGQANVLILNSLAERGITDILPAHGAVLNALFERGPLQMNELAESIGRKKNTVTGLINTLEDRGYCRREPDPDDARAQLIVLTEKGESMRRVQHEVSADLLRKAWGGVSGQEQISCIQSLETVLHNLRQD